MRLWPFKKPEDIEADPRYRGTGPRKAPPERPEPKPSVVPQASDTPIKDVSGE